MLGNLIGQQIGFIAQVGDIGLVHHDFADLPRHAQHGPCQDGQRTGKPQQQPAF